jgi:hypothetical protein
MHLLAVVQAARVYTHGPSPASLAAWHVVFDLAVRLNDIEYQARALWGLWNDNTYGGAHDAALTFAERFAALGVAHADTAKQIVGRRLLGISHHYRGDQATAREDLEYVLSHYDRDLHRWQTIGYRLDQGPVTRATLARVLWLQGASEQAWHQSERGLQDAQTEDHVQSMLYILVEASIPLSLLNGDLRTAASLLEILRVQAARSSFMIWETYARCFKEMLLVVGGDADRGLPQLRDAITELQEIGFCAHLTMFLAALAEGELRAGRAEDALSTIGVALDWCDAHEERWCMAELLRIKAEIIGRETSPAAIAQAEHHLHQALDWARRQDALSWELRVALSLARFRIVQDRRDDARQILAPIYNRFAEGFETADVRSARAMLESLPPHHVDSEETLALPK